MIREDDTRYTNGRDDSKANKNASFFRRFFLTRREKERSRGTDTGKERSNFSIEERNFVSTAKAHRVEDGLRFIDAQQGRTRRSRERLPTRRLDERPRRGQHLQRACRSREVKSVGLDRSQPSPPSAQSKTSGPEFLHAVAWGLAPTYHEWHETPPGESSRPK